MLAILLSASLVAAQAPPPSATSGSTSSASPPATTSTQPNTNSTPTSAAPSVPAPATGAPNQSSSTTTDTANSPTGESASAPLAPPTPEQQAQAATVVAQGQAAYGAGDYVLAETLFRQSMALAPSPEAQYGLAMALDLQGKPTEAVGAFEALLLMPDHARLPAEQIAAATQRLNVLKSIPASVVVEVTADPGASGGDAPYVSNVQLTVDGEPQTGAAPFALKLSAGEHELVARAPGFEPRVLKLTVRPAESIRETLVLAAIPAPPPEPVAPVAAETLPPVPMAVNKTPAFVTLGVAGAAAVVGTVFGVQALSAQDDFEASPTVAHADDVERNALIADMAFGIALTLGVTGVVLLLADEPPPETTASTASESVLRVFPFVSSNAGGAAAHVAF